MIDIQSYDLVLTLIQSYMGKPYIWGGDDPITGFDCSGIVLEILHSFGLGPLGDASSQQLYDYFKTRASLTAKFGSLAFYGASTSKINHVVFCLSDKLMFEMGGGDRTVTSAEVASQKNAYGRIRPILRRNDLVAVVNPPWPWG